MTLSEAFAQLGLPPDSDGRAVRRAYAQFHESLWLGHLIQTLEQLRVSPAHCTPIRVGGQPQLCECLAQSHGYSRSGRNWSASILASRSSSRLRGCANLRSSCVSSATSRLRIASASRLRHWPSSCAWCRSARADRKSTRLNSSHT